MKNRPAKLILSLSLLLGAIQPLSLQAGAIQEGHPKEANAAIESWLTGPGATGNWFGLRRDLTDHGVTISGAYLADFQGNVVGGKSKGFGYFQQLYLQLQLDLEKIVGWKGANFYFRGYQMAGSDLSNQHIGNYFDVTELATINSLNVSNIYLDQKLLNEQLWLKIGRLNISKDFGSLPVFGLYIGVIDAHPPSFDYNTFYTSSPKSTWGFSTRWRASDDLEFKYGIYQATAEKNVVPNHGLNMYFQATDGIQQFWEISWSPTFGKNSTKSRGSAPPSSETPGSVDNLEKTGPKNTIHSQEPLLADDDSEDDGYSGVYNIGAYYTNWSFTSFSGAAVRDNYGFYAFGQQLIWKERAGTSEGITLWSAFTYAPQDDIVTIPFFAGAGLVWEGLIPTRDNDSLLFGSYYGNLGGDYADAENAAGLGRPTYEWVLELGYVAHITPWLYVTPDIQWVINPGGTGSIPNALVIGWELGVTF